MSNYKSKRSWKRIGKALLIALCVILSLGAVASFTGASMNPVEWFKKDLNPDNLLTIDHYDDEKDRIATTGYGVDFKFNDDGVITVYGKNGDPSVGENEVKKYSFATITLNAGQYTISGYDKAQLNTLGVYAEANGETYWGDTENDTFTLTETTTVTIGLYVGNDKLFVNAKLYPVLVTGDEAGEFYA